MGAAVRFLCNSKVENDYFHMVNRQYNKYKRLFKCLGFTESAGRELIKVFYRLDADGSRSVDYDEFAKFFDDIHDGSMDYDEMIEFILDFEAADKRPAAREV